MGLVTFGQPAEYRASGYELAFLARVRAICRGWWNSSSWDGKDPVRPFTPVRKGLPNRDREGAAT
jgi:hypothetical protein